MPEPIASGRKGSLVTLPNKVLVTGHTGFKGAWLTLLLEELGVEVVGYSLAPEESSLYSRLSRSEKISESYQDICDYVSLDEFILKHKPDAIIHMAAQPLVLQSYKDPFATFETNVRGTVNVMQSATKTGFVRAVLVVTTDKVYENIGKGKFFIEGDPLRGSDPYSASKVATEAVVRAWQTLSKFSQVPALATVRAGNVIGGGDYSENRIIPDVIRSIEGKAELRIRNFEATRPWQHVIEPLFAYVLVLGKLLDGYEIESMNIGPDGESLSVGAIIEGAREVFPNHNLFTVNSTRSQANSFHEALNLQLNSDQIKKICDWEPIWTQQEAIRLTFKWWEKVLAGKETALSACEADLKMYFNLISGKYTFRNLERI